jgi:hypothetical protein
MEEIMQRVSGDIVGSLVERRRALEQIKASAAAIMSPSNDDVDDQTADPESPTHSTTVQAKRILNKITADGRDLEYSIRNLQNTVRSIGDAANKIDMWMQEFPSDGLDDSQPVSILGRCKAQALVKQLQGDGPPITLPPNGDFTELLCGDDAKQPASAVTGLRSWLASLWKS